MHATFKFILLAGLIALSPLTLGAQPEKQPPQKEPLKKADEKPVVIPFELLKSRHMAIQVKINDKGPYRLIFDTGAPTNLVNNKVAKEAGLLTKADKGGLPIFGAAPAPKTIKKLEIGELKLEGMGTMVMDHPTVAAIAEVVGPVEGIIGFPFFARYKMTIDYEKKEMTLVPNGYQPGDAMQGLMDKIMSGSKGQKPEPTVIAPAAVWGFTVDKDKADEDAGVKVTEVLAKSQAAAGGLKVGDRLLTLDGRWTDTVGDTFIAASSVKPGKPAVLVVKRDGKEVKLTVTPGKGL
jgi:Aspartyl protease/PDZ domain